MSGLSERLNGVSLRVLTLMAFLSLSACGPLISFGDDGPADDVYSLRYDGAYSPPQAGAALIYIEQPLMGDGLGGQTISVVLENERRTRLQGVAWSANSADLIRGYMVRALSAVPNADFVGEGGLDIDASCYLGLKVWEFEFAPGAEKADDTVNVAIEFSLVRYSDSVLLGRPTYKVVEPVSGTGTEGVVLAFQRAIASIGRSGKSWILDNASQCTG